MLPNETNMKTICTKVTTFVAILFFCTAVHAQVEISNLLPDTSQVYLVNLNDNMELYGVISDMKEDIIVFQSEKYGEIQFDAAEVNWVEPVLLSGTRYSKKYNKNADHYFMLPSAFQLKKRDGYIRSTYLLYNSFSYGLTDNVSVSGGVDLLHLMTSVAGKNDFGNLYYVSVKGSMKISDQLRLGIGAYKMRIYKFDYTMPMASMTLGNRNSHVTLSYGQNIQNMTTTNSNMYMVGAQKRINDQLYIIGEYVQFPTVMDEGASSQAVFSYGIRYSTSKVDFDLSLYNNKSIKNYFPFGIPLFSCTFQL